MVKISDEGDKIQRVEVGNISDLSIEPNQSSRSSCLTKNLNTPRAFSLSGALEKDYIS